MPRSLLYFLLLVQGGVLTHMVLIPMYVHADMLAIDIFGHQHVSRLERFLT